MDQRVAPSDSDQGCRDDGSGEQSGRSTPLCALTRGSHGTMLAVDDEPSAALLKALGLTRRSRFEVCQAGKPWILKVRSTRIGLTDALARRVMVTQEAE